MSTSINGGRDAAIRDMILAAVGDPVENARLDNGLFYYKELPSIQRMGNNAIILEALAIAYDSFLLLPFTVPV